MDPKNFGPNGRFVMTKKIVSLHSWHLCSLALVVACSFYRGIILCLFFELCRDRIFYVTIELC